jgi:proton-coupled amino acid transporter
MADSAYESPSSLELLHHRSTTDPATTTTTHGHEYDSKGIQSRGVPAPEIELADLRHHTDPNGHSHSDREDAFAHEAMDPHALETGGGDMKAAILGSVKAMVGPAILYLPHGFVSAGYATALPIMMVATVLYWHSSACLLEVWRAESQQQLVPASSLEEDVTDEAQEVFVDEPASSHAAPLSYADLAARAFGTPGETLVKLGIACMQSGVCLTYLIFVPHNLRSSILQLTNVRVSTAVCLWAMVAVQIPLAWIRDIRHFRHTNALANALIVYGLLVCVGFAVAAALAPWPSEKYYDEGGNRNASSLSNLWPHVRQLSPWGDHWILFIGMAVLLFEGSITLLLPLQQAIHVGSDDRERFPHVYPRVILAIQVFYFFFAVICWMGFGDDVHVVLTTSLPVGRLATTVQLAYSLAVLLTFPLQNYPALEIACHAIQEQFRAHSFLLTSVPPPWQGWLMKRDVIAAVLVCLLAVVALCTMDSLDKVASLTGALVGIPIAFMIPPMIHNQLMPHLTPLRRQQNYAVTLLGFCAMVLASVTTIYQWND